MDVLKDIAAQTDVVHTFSRVDFDLTNKTAFMHVTVNGMMMNVVVDVTPILTAATDTQRTIIRGFFKTVIAAGLDVLEANVPDAFV